MNSKVLLLNNFKLIITKQNKNTQKCDRTPYYPKIKNESRGARISRVKSTHKILLDFCSARPVGLRKAFHPRNPRLYNIKGKSHSVVQQSGWFLLSPFLLMAGDFQAEPSFKSFWRISRFKLASKK